MTHQDSEPDYDTVMRGNAARVFGERDPDKRLAALAELWSVDGTLYEQEPVSGYQAISDSITALLGQLPPDTVFMPVGPAIGHHGVGLLRWAAGPRGGEPGPVRGTDVARIEHGRIRDLYVFLDPPASGSAHDPVVATEIRS